ncbi:hypothetical protein PVAND_011468 [Polypedilum vanderplanki]|uniref:Tropomyosin n=1 Tax=Polypedilum vanderplanki TaxID=319348 RepID=A0A9J6CIP8_POLVA|nr:hypothetical protein PVAND_011468 [Polypedilum vanderplanki]
MDAIKKKMQAMKLEKDNALDRALLCEQQARDANTRAEKAEEEARTLQKKIQTIENDLDQTQEQETLVNGKLEEKEKALQNIEKKYVIKKFSPNGINTMTERSAHPTNKSRRGHQYHPKNIGSRGTCRNVPTSEIIEALREGRNLESLFIQHHQSQHENIQSDLPSDLTLSTSSDASSQSDQTTTFHNLDFNSREEFQENISEEISISSNTQKYSKSSEPKRKRSKGSQNDVLRVVQSTSNEILNNINEDDDAEMVELAKLRCTSERTEVIAEREHRRQKKCADYPGLAFGRSIFSSDSMMKFNIIRNELQNIMNNQLRRKKVSTMTTNLQQGTLLDVLKKKMRQTKEEMERYKDECEEFNRKYQLEAMRREEAESEVAALNRRIQLLEEDLERSEERLASATAKLSEASAAADESERARKVLENRSLADEERMDALENQLKEARFLAEEADKKYDEVARKLAMVEADLERAEERAEAGEAKIVELEEELRVVGNNLKSLEVSEEKATQREETFEGQVRILEGHLKEAEARAEFAERSVQKLQKEVDRLEDELLNERARNKMLQEEMEATLHDIQNM